MQNHIKVSGYSLVTIGIIHTLFGVLFDFPILASIVGDGFNSVAAGQLEREALFWFLMSGLLFILLGASISKLRQVPRYVAWGLLLWFSLSTFVMPVSGLWLAVAQAAYMVWASYQKSFTVSLRHESTRL